MQKTKGAFLLYIDTLTVLDEISDVQCATLFRAIAHYHSDGILPEMDQLTKALFIMFKTKFDVDTKSYNKKIEERSTSGKLGNLKRWNEELYNLVMKNGLSLEEAYNIHENKIADETYKKYGLDRKVSHSDKNIANDDIATDLSQNSQKREIIATDPLPLPLPLPLPKQEPLHDPLHVSGDHKNFEKFEKIRKKVIENAMKKSFYKSNWSFLPDGVKEQDYKLGVYDAIADWILHNDKDGDFDFLESTLMVVKDIYTHTSNNPDVIANIRECISSNKPILIPDSMRSVFKKIQEANTPLSPEEMVKKCQEAMAKLRKKDGE